MVPKPMPVRIFRVFRGFHGGNCFNQFWALQITSKVSSIKPVWIWLGFLHLVRNLSRLLV